MRCVLIFFGLLLIILIVNNGNMWGRGHRIKNELKIEM